MIGPGGHYLDNLIESYYFFKDNFEIFSLLNTSFNSKNTFIPNELKIYKILNRNIFEKKERKILHYLFEFFSILHRFFLTIILVFFFLYKRNLINYLIAVTANRLIIPKYFLEIFNFINKNKFTTNDHIFFSNNKKQAYVFSKFFS